MANTYITETSSDTLDDRTFEGFQNITWEDGTYTTTTIGVDNSLDLIVSANIIAFELSTKLILMNPPKVSISVPVVVIPTQLSKYMDKFLVELSNKDEAITIDSSIRKGYYGDL